MFFFKYLLTYGELSFAASPTLLRSRILEWGKKEESAPPRGAFGQIPQRGAGSSRRVLPEIWFLFPWSYFYSACLIVSHSIWSSLGILFSWNKYKGWAACRGVATEIWARGLVRRMREPMRSWNVWQCQKSESTPPVGWDRAEFHSGTMRLNNYKGQNYIYFQNSTVHSFKPMEDETLQ